MRLDKFVSAFVSSRSEAKKVIKDGRITVGGAAVKDGGYIIDENASDIKMDGAPLKYEPYIYLMMNKPAGVICATEDKRHETVIDLLPEKYRRFRPFPVGRLDIDTEGLVILTNDGDTAHRLLSPRYKVPKKYKAILDSDADTADIDIFGEGVTLGDGYKTKPAVLEISDRKNEVTVSIIEGKFHQVKRMFLAVGKKVIYLKRIEFASIPLDETLKKGEVRALTEKERDALLL